MNSKTSDTATPSTAGSVREALEKTASVDVRHWGVTVAVNGNDVLTIESNHLSGVSDIEQHTETIRTCAHHLLGFIGDGANVNSAREAFRAGWYVNAIEAGDGEDQQPADYLAGCEQVDWEEYQKKATLSAPVEAPVAVKRPVLVDDQNSASGKRVEWHATPHPLPSVDEVARLIDPTSFSIKPSAYGLASEAEVEDNTWAGSGRKIARDKATAILTLLGGSAR